MKSLPERIMEHAEATPEATPICPTALLHLGKQGAVNQALSRLARSGRLMRICQGIYMRPIQTRFGRCAPSIYKSLQALSETLGARTNSPEWWRRGQLAWVDDAESGPLGLSHLRPQPAIVLCQAPRRSAPCATMAAGRAVPDGGGGHPAPWHGSAPKKSKTASTPCCPNSRSQNSTSLRPRGPSCPSGWPSH